KIKKALVGTHNPQFLSLALHFVKELKIHTYLFRESLDVSVEEKKGAFSPANSIDLEQIVDFGQLSTEGNKEWLRGYFAKLIEKGALFQLIAKGQIIGTCEVRKSITHPAHADIGMIVSPEFRGQGYGTFLLNKAKTIAQEWGRIPICSCEKDNPASFQAISHCGFRSNFQLLEISFD
ncbi:MAG: GNAT family N-acetyltransferase, partial [Bacteroidota bacterium]